jgi:predicted alpha-1,6-mannanase (GH76 family)
VVEVIQRADATAPTTTTPRKRTAALVLDSAAVSTARRRQSVDGATVAMASRQGGVYFVSPRLAKRNIS